MDEDDDHVSESTVSESQRKARPENKEEEEEDGEDPLDAFMSGVHQEPLSGKLPLPSDGAKDQRRPGEDEEGEEEEAEEEDSLTRLLNLAQERAKKRDAPVVDHSTMKYPPFTRVFYQEPPELARLNAEEKAALRSPTDPGEGMRVRGKRVPAPITRWSQAGLPSRVHPILEKYHFTSPTPIQRQALPIAMQGRDMIGVAKTGSGKTLAFLLPLLRHIHGQTPGPGPSSTTVAGGGAPHAIILAPTRELAIQIHREARPFLRVLGLKGACVYGGAPIKEHIGLMKGGPHLLVGTPGRIIDLLAANQGRVLQLHRVTIAVLDEADRMFDLGFEPQVMKIIGSIRPDRQVLLFSATFPRLMEALARRLLRYKPAEVVVGERSVVSGEVEQSVNVFHPTEQEGGEEGVRKAKFRRLLQLLGEYFSSSDPSKNEGEEEDEEEDERGKRALIFVERQDGTDRLFGDLAGRGYRTQTLHGGKDQMDRENALADFRSGVCPILLATSVASRGLDVRGLDLVVNYDCPSHMEDYVHRVGRTGRAGRKGRAVTFIVAGWEGKAAVGVKRAMEASAASIPGDLIKVVKDWEEESKGLEGSGGGGGFGGRGLDRLGEDREVSKYIQGHRYLEAAGGDEEAEKEKEKVRVAEALTELTRRKQQQEEEEQKEKESRLPEATRAAMAEINKRIKPTQDASDTSKPLTGQDLAARLAAKTSEIMARATSATSTSGTKRLASDELDVNDFPQSARWAVMRKENLMKVSDLAGVAITTKGVHVPKGQSVPKGQRKLYLLLEAETPYMVERAKVELRRLLEEKTMMFLEHEARGGIGGGSGGGGSKFLITR
ncbi:MAG: P-loop containing nucleoside triphosphate hydrolase protein [Piptocephalis tieghemiana]|nr:MAG: P-loop containing nucleoside triphosphate hydrolase protein [Piptocephalis tieghemiana]